MTVRDAVFHHHRLTGQRDGSRFKAWVRQGQASHFMAYRPLYLTARVIYHLTRERAAMGMLLGYLQSALTRAPQCHDDAVRAMVRSRQTLPKLPARIREKRGQTSRR
jgi:hypothetical protein